MLFLIDPNKPTKQGCTLYIVPCTRFCKDVSYPLYGVPI